MTINAQLKALSKISSAITSDQYLEDILRLIVMVTAELLNSKICSLMLINEQTGQLEVRATQSVSEAYNNKGPLRLNEGIAGKVASENKARYIQDVTKDKEYKFRDIAIKEGLKSLLCMPLCVKNKVIGVLNCYTSEEHKFSKSEISTITAIANQAAVAIENTELMVKSKVIQEELETRKKVERAKGVLMRDNGLNEEEAYLKLQKFAMDNRKSMRDIADIVIMAEQVKQT